MGIPVNQVPPAEITPTVQQFPVQYVNTPAGAEQTDVNQQQTSTSGATATSSPKIVDNGYNAYTQYNLGAGDHAQTCMTNVGCADEMSLDLAVYYDGTSHSSNIHDLNTGDSRSSYGVQLLLRTPIGDATDGAFTRAAKAQADIKEVEATLGRARVIRENIDSDIYMAKNCAAMQRDGVVLDSGGSGLARRLAAICQGITVARVVQDEANSKYAQLEAENAKLRAIIKQIGKRQHTPN